MGAVVERRWTWSIGFTVHRLQKGQGVRDLSCSSRIVSYGPPWAHYLGGYQDRLLGGPLGLLDLRSTAPDGVKHKDYRGEVLG
jgi:hypothetical protein